MKRLLSFSCLVLALAGCSAPAPNPPPQTQGPSGPWSSEMSTSKRPDGSTEVKISNRHYLFRDVVYLDQDNAKPVSILAKQEVLSTYHLQSDSPPDTSLKAEAWQGETNFTGAPVWSLQADAEKGEITDRFFVTTKNAFLDDFPVYTFFSLMDGKKVYVSNTPLLSVSTVSTPYLTRYLTYRAQFADHELPASLLAPKFTGIVTYGDSTKALHTLAIYGWPEDDKPAIPTLYLEYNGHRVETPELYLRENEGAAPAVFSQFSLILTLSDESEIEIPFKNDAPVTGDAHLPSGYSLKEIPAF